MILIPIDHTVKTVANVIGIIVFLTNANSLSGTSVHYRAGTARRRDDCHSELQALPKATRVAPQVESLN